MKYTSLSLSEWKLTKGSSWSPQDTVGIFRRTSGNTGFGYQSSDFFPEMGTIPCQNVRISVRTVALALFVLRGRRFCTSGTACWQVGRSLTSNMLSLPRQIRTKFCKLTSNFLIWAVAVTSLPGLSACRPWQAASGLLLELNHVDCWGPSSTHQETRTSPCSSATIFGHFSRFFLENCLLPRYFTKTRTRF